MRYGKVAILITIAAAALRCSGNPPVSEPGQAVLNAPSAVVINAIDHQETPAGTEVVLHGNYPFSYTSYQPDPRTLVLELLDVHVEGLSQEVQIGTPQVEGVRVTSVESVDGGKIAKFEFKNVLAAQHSIRLEGHDLIVDFPSLGEGGNAPESPIVAETSSAAAPSTAAEGAPESGAPSAGTSPRISAIPAEGAPIETVQSTPPPAEGTTDGAAAGTPEATRPKPVVRVVLDMSSPRPYAIVPTETGLVVDFTEEGVRHALETEPQQVQPVASSLAAETPAEKTTNAETPAAEPSTPAAASNT